MRVIGNHILVVFEKNNVFRSGELELEKPVGVYEFDEAHQERRFMTDGNINRLEVNPQIATIVASSEKFNLKKGDKVLMHYMAWEWCKEEKPLDIEGQDVYRTEGEYVLGYIRNDQYFPVDNTYFGKRVYLEAPKTASGIFLSPYDKINQASHIQITHLPEITLRDYKFLTKGQIAITVDDKQYPFMIGEEEYIKLTAEEIVGWVDEGVLEPIA